MMWSKGTLLENNDLVPENVSSCIKSALERRCSYCNRHGASINCTFNNCDKVFHFPCAAASTSFQHLKTYTLICNHHLDHIPLLREYLIL